MAGDERFETCLGPNTATSLMSLAGLHVAMGKYAEVVPLYEEVLGIHEAQLGPDHPDTATSLGNLAKVYEAVGEHAKALEKFTMALQMQLKLGLHVEAAVTQGEIGSVQLYQGKFKDALLSLREAEAVLLRTEDKQIEAARTQRNIGQCLYRLSKYDDAESSHVQSIR